MPRFQSTHPRGVRLAGTVAAGFPVSVSIHAPAWGATREFKRIMAEQMDVSIHAPAWGATPGLQHLVHLPLVSIHAPAWGATRLCEENRSLTEVSIHAPAWGATMFCSAPYPMNWGFNPRTRVGCDLVQGKFVHIAAQVSIHAPAWGATSTSTMPRQLSRVSIHAPAWGATMSERAPERLSMFQSTHPRGVRLFPCFIQ